MLASAKLNLHTIDRFFRFFGGAVLTYATLPGSNIFDDQFFRYPVLLFGIVNIIVAIIGWCPVYSVLNISSKSSKTE